MKLYASVKFLASDKESFTSDNGDYVEYYKNAIRGEGGIMELNSKANYSECEGMEGIVEIEAQERDNGRGFKLTLRKFIEGEELVIPEDVFK